MDLGLLLSQTLNPQTQKQGWFVVKFVAETHLAQAEATQGFSLALLDVVLASNDPSGSSSPIRLAAVLYFKNFVRKHWPQVLF